MVDEIKTIQTDVLIVGTGAAGGRAAIEAARNNVNVIIVDKMFLGKAGTSAQAGARAHRFQQNRLPPEPRLKFHVGVGCYLNDQDVLWKIMQECDDENKYMKKLAEEMNAPSEHNANYALGYEISKFTNVNVMENTIITKLLLTGGKIVGATALDVVNGVFIVFKAKAVVLATGGYGDLYRPSECAPLGINGGVTGDGQSLAYHAGAEITEMEMSNQQCLPDSPKFNRWYRHLIGSGHAFPFGPFLDKDGKPLPGLSEEEITHQPIGCGPPLHKPAHTYRPLLELMVYKESLKAPVYINALEIAKHQLADGYELRAPDKALKIDPMKLPTRVKVVIGLLIGQGGPKINVKGETTVPGLYAAGECPGNVYGAYRANPFMDSTLPMGKFAGKSAADHAKTTEQGDIDPKEIAEEKARVYGFLEVKSDPISPVAFKKKIWALTDKHLFMIRNEQGLKEAIEMVEAMRTKDLPRLQAVNIKRMNVDWVEAIQIPFMLDTAEMIARSALFRTESRGAHYRDDFPEVDNKNWLCHTTLKKDGDEMKLYKTPVVMTKYKPPSKIGEEPVPI